MRATRMTVGWKARDHVSESTNSEGAFPEALNMPDNARYSARYPMAMAYAAMKHAGQARKNPSATPYIGHPVAVSMLVWDHIDAAGLHAEDVPEDLAIAALLHDVAEDAGGQEAVEEIMALFGERVGEIVDLCSDALPLPGQDKAPWRGRKEQHLARVALLADSDSAGCDPGACLVIACDKLHNLTETAADVQRDGPSAMDYPRFRGGLEGTRWYYRQVRDILAPAIPPALLERIDAQLAVIEAAGSR